MNAEDYIRTFVRQITDVIEKPTLNQRDFREVIEIAEVAIRELDEMEAEWRADMEIGNMTEQVKTESWIIKHPARIHRPGQIEIVRNVPDFNQAIAEASKFHSIISERHSRSQVRHDSTKDFFTVVEMEAGSTAQDVREAFIKGEGFVKLLHLDDLFR